MYPVLALGTHADETHVISDNSTEGSTANPADAIAPSDTDVTNGGAASSSDFDSEWTRLASIFQPDTNGANEAESIGHNAFRQAQETYPSLKHWWGLARQSSKILCHTPWITVETKRAAHGRP